VELRRGERGRVRGREEDMNFFSTTFSLFVTTKN